MIWPTAPFVHALGHMWFQWEPVLTPWQCWCQLVSGSHQYYRHRTPKSLNVIALVPEQWPDFRTLICDRVFGKEMKNEMCWWKMSCDVFVITTEMAVPGLCFADHNVCWIHAKKSSEEKMSDQWVHCCFFIPHSFELIYLTGASDKHHLSDALVDASNLTKFHLRTLPSGYASVPVALKEAHMRQNVSMWERRGQSQYRPHTPLLCSAA